MDIGKKRKEIQAQIQALQEASRNASSQNQSATATPPPMNITKQFEQAYENNLEQTEQVNNSFKNNAKWVGKKGLFGAKSGTIGIGQGILTDTANEARKGEESSGVDLIADGMNAIMSMVPGIGNSLGTAINSGRKIAKGEKGQKEKQTVGQMLVDASSGAMNEMPFKKTTNALIRIAGNLVARNSNNRMSDAYLAANNMLQKPLDEQSEKLAKEGEQYGKTTQFIGNATESVGNMVPSIGVGLLTKNPTAALAAMGASVKGRSTNETLKRLDKENYGYAEDFGGEAGNIDINHRQVYKNPDGKISTEKSETYGFTDENGKEKYYVLPTIIDGKDYSNDSDFVVNHFLETGEHLGAFDNEDDANRYAEDLHQRQEQYYSPEETRKRQSKQLDEAVKRGDTDAIIEVGTEMLTGGVKLFGKGTLDEIGESVVKQCKNEVLRFFVQQGVNVTGEIVEEAVSDILGTIIDKGTVDPDAKYTLKDFGETAAQTILTTMILNAFGIGDIKSAIDRNNLRTQINNTSYNENQKAYWNKQIQNNKITNSAQLGNEIDRVTKIDEIIDKTNLSEEQKSQLREYAREYNSQVGQIQNYSNYLSEQKQKNTKTEKNEKVEEKQSTTIKNKPLLESKQQTTLPENKTEEKKTTQQKQVKEVKTEKKELNQKQRKDVANFTAKYALEHDNFSAEASQKLQSYAYENNITAEELSKMSDKKIGELSGVKVEENKTNRAVETKNNNAEPTKKELNELDKQRKIEKQKEKQKKKEQEIKNERSEAQRLLNSKSLPSSEIDNYIPTEQDLKDIDNQKKEERRNKELQKLTEEQKKELEKETYDEETERNIRYREIEKDDLKNYQNRSNENQRRILENKEKEAEKDYEKLEKLREKLTKRHNEYVENAFVDKDGNTREDKLNDFFEWMEREKKTTSPADDQLFSFVKEFNKARQNEHKALLESSKKAEAEAIQFLEEQKKKDIKEQTQKVEETQGVLPEAKATEELNKTLNEAVDNQQVQKEQREIVEEPKDLNTRKNEIYEALNNPDEYTPEELNSFERELADIIIEQNKQQTQETQSTQTEETEQQSQGTPVMQEDNGMLSDADYVSDTEYNRESPTEEELNQTMQEADEETKREAEKIGVNADVYEHANKYHGYNRKTSNHNNRVKRKYEKGLSKIQNKIDVLMEQQKDLRSSLKVDDNNYSDTKIKEIQDKISDIGNKLNALYKQKTEYQKEYKYGKKGMWHLDDAQIQDEGLDYGRQIVDTLQNENATAKDKLKVLDNIKNFAVVSFDTFKDIYDTIRFPEEQAEHLEKNKVDMKNEYNKYLDEKLRKSLYNGLKRHYDKVTMYDSDKLRQKESEAIVSRAWQNKRGKLVNEMGDALKILNFDGKKTNKITSPLKTLSLWRSNMIRANEKAFGFEQGTAINNTIFRPLEHHLAEMQKFINDTHKKILDLGIKQNSSESTDLFDYMEQTITEEGIREKYKNNPEMGEKIIQAGETLQQMYDDLFYDVNDILSEYGFSTIKYRKNYVTHFQNAEDALSTLMKSITGEQSIEATENQIRNIANQELSQDKQRATSGYEQQRHTEEAQQKDAIMAAMKYVQNISSVKYLTEDIQKLRAFEQLMRQYNGMENITDSTDLTGLTQNKLNQVEKNQLEKFRTDKQFHEYVNWLNQYTNVLAGGQLKFEEAFPPKVVKALNAFKSRTGSNMVGLNMKTPATNFISGILGISKTNKIAALRAIGQMMNNSITKTDDGVMKNSDLYTRRQGNTYTIEKTSKLGRFDQKAQEFGMKPMGFTDDIMTEFIIRSKYNEGLKRFQNKYTDSNGNINYEGLKEEAMKYADDHASRILGERSRGTMPLLFESKALGALTQFQLEVNNQLDVFTHDFFRQKYQDVKEYGENELNADIKAVSQATQLIVFQHLFNEAYDAVLGGRPAFDIIDVLQTAFGKGDDDDENDGLSVENLGKASKQLIEMLPFINIISPNARVPIAGVLEDMLSDTKGLVEGALEGDKKKRNKNAYALAQNLGSNVVLPTGGMQAKRSLQTAATYIRNGNYNASGQLRYPLQEEDKTPARFAQALLWGRGNLPTAKRYEERGYKPLNDKQTEEFNSLNDVSYEDYLTIIDANKKEEGAYYKGNTVNRINQAVKNEDDRWTLYQNYVMSDSQKAKFDEFLSSGFGTKEDILNNYDYMRENEINLPNYDKVEEMIDNGVNLDSYVKYQKDLDNMKDDQEQKELLYKLLKGKEVDLKSPDADAKATILMDDKYSDEEREALYKTFAGSDKDVSTYENFRDMGTGDSDEISTWLNFVIADTAATKKTGAYDNKTKTENDKQDKIEAFFNQHPEINETQRAYIKVNNGFKKITSRERDLINEYVKRLEPEDYNKFFDNINQGFVGINYSDDGGRNYVEWLNKKIK